MAPTVAHGPHTRAAARPLGAPAGAARWPPLHPVAAAGVRGPRGQRRPRVSRAATPTSPAVSEGCERQDPAPAPDPWRSHVGYLERLYQLSPLLLQQAAAAAEARGRYSSQPAGERASSSSGSSSGSGGSGAGRSSNSDAAAADHSLSAAGAPWARGLFLVSVDDKPPTKQNRNSQGEKCPDYYANVGDAIRTLREDVPQLFERELNFDIYRDDIVFRDPRNTFAGMQNYRLIFWSLRFHGRIFFKRLYVEVRRIWQPQDGLICMRWTVHGIPRVPWEAEGTFDGISQYKLDGEGRIYEHAVDNVILRDPPMQGIGPLLAGLNLVPGAPQQPVPGAWMRGLEEGAAAAAVSSASAAAVASAAGGGGSPIGIPALSWLRLYAALLGTMQLQELLGRPQQQLLGAVQLLAGQQRQQQEQERRLAYAVQGADGGAGALPAAADSH